MDYAQGMTLLSMCFTAAVNISSPMVQKRKLLGQGYTDIGIGTGGQKQGQKNREGGAGTGTGTGTRTERLQRHLRCHEFGVNVRRNHEWCGQKDELVALKKKGKSKQW